MPDTHFASINMAFGAAILLLLAFTFLAQVMLWFLSSLSSSLSYRSSTPQIIYALKILQE
jgi:hypothetical protein